MNKILIALVLTLGSLDPSICEVEVKCDSKIDDSDRPRQEVCYIRDFPFSNPNLEAYRFHVGYTDRTAIKEVEFLPSEGVFPTVGFIPTQIFIAFPNLRDLRMTTNLRELDSDSFTNAMSLNSLHLIRNKLKIVRRNVFSTQSSLHALRTLSLSRNEISEIEPYSFQGLNRLFELNLQNNRLKMIRRHTFVGLPSLGILDLQDNEIETIEDEAFDLPALELLYLGKNKLRRLSDAVFDRMPLLTIKLNNNELEHIGRSLYGSPTITFISLEGNRIQDIDLVAFAKMSSLKLLTLTHSGFKFATTRIVDGEQWNSALERLEIADNNLTDPMELNKLQLFPKLKVLNLNGNAYTNLEIGGNRTLKDVLPSLETVSLLRLRINSDNLLTIRQQLKTDHVFVLDGNDNESLWNEYD